MSILLMTQAFAAEIKNPTAKLILLKLADNANDHGYCFPSIEYIAEQCSVHPRTVKRQIKYLVKLGFLEVKARFNNNKQRSNEYIVHIGSPIESGGDILPPLDEKEQFRGDTRSPVGVTEDHPESLDLSNRIEKDKTISSFDNEQEDLKVAHLEKEFIRLWEIWPNSKNKIRSVSAFKRSCNGKSPNAITSMITDLRIDVQKRLNANQLGFKGMMLSTYLNNGRFDDDITNENNESVKQMDDAKKSGNAKTEQMMKDLGYTK